MKKQSETPLFKTLIDTFDIQFAKHVWLEKLNRNRWDRLVESPRWLIEDALYDYDE